MGGEQEVGGIGIEGTMSCGVGGRKHSTSATLVLPDSLDGDEERTPMLGVSGGVLSGSIALLKAGTGLSIGALPVIGDGG